MKMRGLFMANFEIFFFPIEEDLNVRGIHNQTTQWYNVV